MATAKLYNGARMHTATTGTGTITLSTAVSGFLTFAQAGVSNGETVSYSIKDGVQLEVGRGVYTSSGTSLTRSVLKSTNSNSAITLSGAAEVMITALAEDFDINDFTAETAPALADLVEIFDASASAKRKMTLENLLNVINLITTDSSPDVFADYLLTYDTSGTASKKVLASLFMRRKLTANTNFYVRSDGSNSNNGLANSSGGAWLTLQYAVDYITQNYDCGGYQAFVNVGAGTFAGISVYSGALGAPAGALAGIKLIGDTTTPSNVVINSTVTVTGANASIIMEGFKYTTVSGNCLYASGGGFISISGKIEFGSCGQFHMQTNVGGNIVVATTNYIISGSAQCHYICNKFGVTEVNATSVTMTSAPAFSLCFAGSIAGYLIHGGCTFVNPTVTITIASPGVVTYTGHNKLANEALAFSTTGALPTGLTAGTTYYVKTVLNANTFTVSATPGGAVINTTGSQSGVHSITATGQRYLGLSNGIIDSGSAGASYFPGNAAGSVSTGAIYI
jgi:hypothetical protein